MAKYVEFIKDFDFYGSWRWCVAYKKGNCAYIPNNHFDAAVKAGAVIEKEKPKDVNFGIKSKNTRANARTGNPSKAD